MFLKLTKPFGGDVYINLNSVRRFSSVENQTQNLSIKKLTSIVFVGGESEAVDKINVRETPEQIVGMIKTQRTVDLIKNNR